MSHSSDEFHLNPPRRVKRLRELALKDTPSSASTSPTPRTPTPPPAAGAPAPRRRGRKPAGPLSKSAREQLRKTNHSVIEKRRREKINEALAALRELVPNDKQDGERKEDKEFKLEVLVRTVEYLRIMVDRVKNLEAALCQKCGGNLLSGTQGSSLKDAQLHRPVKRMRVEEPENIDDDHDAVPHPRLPSISSWMADASLTRIPPPRDTSIPHNSNNSPPHAYQLPSPPQTVPFAPTTIAATGFPPRLVLPAPIGPSSLASPAPFASPPPGSSLPCPLLTPPAPTTVATSPAFTFLTSPAFVPTHAPRTTTTSRDRGRDRDRDGDVPDLPLDAGADAEHPHSDVLRSPPTTGHGRGGSGRRKNGGSRHGGGGINHSSECIRRGGSGAHHGSASSGSGSHDSPWSRDDQTAASLLLNISSRTGRLGAEGVGPGEGLGEGLGLGQRQQLHRTLTLKDVTDGSDTTTNGTGVDTFSAPHTNTSTRPGTRTCMRRAGDVFEAQTPSSLLGMGEDSGGE